MEESRNRRTFQSRSSSPGLHLGSGQGGDDQVDHQGGDDQVDHQGDDDQVDHQGGQGDDDNSETVPISDLIRVIMKRMVRIESCHTQLR